MTAPDRSFAAALREALMQPDVAEQLEGEFFPREALTESDNELERLVNDGILIEHGGRYALTHSGVERARAGFEAQP